jgi:hypothetical protein
MSVFLLVFVDIRTAITPIYDISGMEKTFSVFQDTSLVLEQGIHFLFAFFLSISLLSSAIERQSITTYVMRFVTVILFSSAMVFVLSQVITNMMTGLPVWVEFSYLPLWFLNNYTTIIMINI